ncbi:MAG: hypothetical protein ABIJ86_14210, partial [Spirochaetota bacterium]
HEAIGGDMFQVKTVLPYPAVEDITKLEPWAIIHEGPAARGSSVDGAHNSVRRWLAKVGYK